MYQQIKKLCIRNFFNSIIIILCLFVCKGNLWAYDRFAEPSVQASWSLSDTKPEKLPLPKTKMRVNRVESDIKLRLYKNTNEVVLYFPGTYCSYVIKCTSLSEAIRVYNNFSIRYTYYIAEDRTYSDHKGDNDEVNAAEIFLVKYLFKRIGDENIYDKHKENKYFDAYNVYMDSETFFYYLNDFDLDEVRGGKVKHQYVDYDDLSKMILRLEEIYEKDTIKNKHWAINESFIK